MEDIVYSAPQPTGLAKAVVDVMAANVADKVGYEPGSKLTPIVEKLGGRIVYRTIGEISDPSSGSIRIEGDNDFEIVLAQHTGPTRDRFTIAHELGHFVLHYRYPRSRGINLTRMIAKRYGTGPVEWEANWFAAGFLMPSAAFRASFEAHNGDIFALADEFRVSYDAARVRVGTLKL